MGELKSILFSALCDAWYGADAKTDTPEEKAARQVQKLEVEKIVHTMYVIDKYISRDRVKLVVFVPVKYAGVIREILGQEGAGVIGDYSHCTVSTRVVARYKKMKNGQIDHHVPLTKAFEECIEAVVQWTLLSRVLSAVRAVHPYEEMGFDIMPLYEARL